MAFLDNLSRVKSIGQNQPVCQFATVIHHVISCIAKSRGNGEWKSIARIKKPAQCCRFFIRLLDYAYGFIGGSSGGSSDGAATIKGPSLINALMISPLS